MDEQDIKTEHGLPTKHFAKEGMQSLYIDSFAIHVLGDVVNLSVYTGDPDTILAFHHGKTEQVNSYCVGRFVMTRTGFNMLYKSLHDTLQELERQQKGVSIEPASK